MSEHDLQPEKRRFSLDSHRLHRPQHGGVGSVFGGRRSGARSRKSETSTAITAEQVELRLEAWVETRLELIKALGESLRERYLDESPIGSATLPGSTSRWRPAFRPINWIDADWVVRVIVPERAIEPVLGFEPPPPPEHEVSSMPSSRRRDAGPDSPDHSIIDLVQGGTGFATYYPVVDSQRRTCGLRQRGLSQRHPDRFLPVRGKAPVTVPLQPHRRRTDDVAYAHGVAEPTDDMAVRGGTSRGCSESPMDARDRAEHRGCRIDSSRSPTRSSSGSESCFPSSWRLGDPHPLKTPGELEH